MDDKKKYYEEKAKELLNFNMMAKQSKMSDNLHKMARGEAIMLECLAHSDNGLMPNEIAKSAHVSTARVAAFLKAVEKKGYIQRISLEGDRRKVNIVLTDIGWDAVKGRRERMLKGVVAYLERLGEEDSTLIEVNVATPDKETASKMCATWEDKDCSQEIYQYVIDKLTN